MSTVRKSYPKLPTSWSPRARSSCSAPCGHRPTVDVVHERHRVPEVGGIAVSVGRNLIRDERDRRLAQHRARRGNAERQAAAVGSGREHAHRAGLPEQHAVRRRLGRGGAGDRAAVAAQHQVDARVAQLVDGRGGGVGAGGVHRFDMDRTAVDAAVLVDQVGGQHDAAVLVDAARPLRSREGIHGAHPDVVRRVVPRARDAHQGHATRERREPPHRRTTARTFAAACVPAGTVHVPDAHRCQESSSPAPRSTGSAAAP